MPTQLKNRHGVREWYAVLKIDGKRKHRLCEQVGCKSFGFHAIRHLSASMMDEANMPLRVVQSQLRHQNATVTSRYLHSLGSRESKLDGVFARENKKAALR